MNIIIEKIRAEVNRLKGICTAQIKANPGQTFPFVMEMTGYDKLLAKLSDLEKEEKPSEGLEEEVKAWHKKHFKSKQVWEYYSGYYLTRSSELNLARHFYELGKQSKPEVSEGLHDFMKKRSESLYFHDDFEIAAYKKGVVEGVQWQKEQMMKGAEKPCHTVEEWMEHIKNAGALTKAIFSKGPYNVLYDALNRPYRDCYDAIKEFGELCYQTARQDMMKEAVEAVISQCPGSNEIIFHNPNSVHSWEFPWKFSAKGLNKGDKVKIIIVKED